MTTIFKNEDGTLKNGKHISENGNIKWYKDGLYHRLEGPALEYSNGDKYWIVEGELHREDGPAIEEDDLPKGYFLNGVEYSESDYYLYKEKKKLNDHLQGKLSTTTKEERHKLKI